MFTHAEPDLLNRAATVATENAENLKGHFVGKYFGLTEAALLGFRIYDIYGNVVWWTGYPGAEGTTEVAATGSYPLDEMLSSVSLLDSTATDAVTAFGGADAVLNAAAEIEFFGVSTPIQVTSARIASKVGDWENPAYGTRSAHVLGTVVSGTRMGLGSATAQGSFTFESEQIIRTAASLGAGTTGVTSTFNLSSSDNWVLIKWDAAATGTVTSTIRYISPSGVSEYPVTATRTSSATDNTLNALTYKGLYPGSYSLHVQTATNAVQDLEIASVGFNL